MARVKNWQTFQHYKGRSPPWIKLHRALLDDYSFGCLPLASKALAPLIWLLAAESQEGVVCADVEWLAFRLRLQNREVEEGLTPLFEKGFLIDASATLASASRPHTNATPETETEGEKEREKAKKSAAPKARTENAIELQSWLDSLAGMDAIPADDPIFQYAERSGIPEDFLELSWRTFVRDMAERRTRKRDWRAHYRNAVRRNWYKLWWFDAADGGRCKLTTSGVQERRNAA